MRNGCRQEGIGSGRKELLNGRKVEHLLEPGNGGLPTRNGEVISGDRKGKRGSRVCTSPIKGGKNHLAVEPCLRLRTKLWIVREVWGGTNNMVLGKGNN